MAFLPETKTVEINGRSYLIKQLKGSWKVRLAAKQAVLLSEASLKFKEFSAYEVGSPEYKVAMVSIFSQRYESKDFVEFVKQVTIEAVDDPNWTEDTWEKYFSKNYGDLNPLFEEIIDFNLGEGDKKKGNSQESEKD